MIIELTRDLIRELTNHLWQSTLFAVAVGVLTVAFRENSARIRYYLWFSASLKFLVPFSLLILLGNRMDWAPAARATVQIPDPAVSVVMTRISQPLSEPLRIAAQAPATRRGVGASTRYAASCVTLKTFPLRTTTHRPR